MTKTKITLLIIFGLIVFFIFPVLVRAFLFIPFRMQMGSMSPTIHEGDMMIVNKLVYRFHNPTKGDIVVFHPPNNPEIYYVKRVIGVPGDSVEIKDGFVFINEIKIQEPYLVFETPGKYGPKKLETDEFFVLGDHRNNSLDSREFGPIKFKSILGKAILILFPSENVKFLNINWR